MKTSTAIPDKMLKVEQAQAIVLESVQPLGREQVALTRCLGRILAEDIRAPYDIPPHANSSVDGYAVRYDDIRQATVDNPVTLRVIEDLPAGCLAEKTVGPGEATRIMTGGVVPPGADTIVMVEYTRPAGKEGVRILQAPQTGSYIRPRGEDVRTGEVVMFAGAALHAGEMGVLASLQRAFIKVGRRPVVAIISTGDEVVDIDQPLDPGKIVNSNSYSLAGLVQQSGGLPRLLGIVGDTEEAIRRTIIEALTADFILSTGGVSVGEYDYVKKVILELGATMKFWKVEMKPGKPLAFGVLRGKPFFGLPGNPVSCMVSFLQFVRPAMRKAMGCQGDLLLPVIIARLENEVHSGGDRRHYLRARVSLREGRFYVSTAAAQGSGVLTSMVGANGLVIVETGVTHLAAGTKVEVQLIGKLEDQRL